MLDKLRDFFGVDAAPEAANTDISVPLAAAILLLEVAWADHEIAPGELDTIGEALREGYAVSDEDIDGLMVRARDFHGQSTGVFPFTRFLVENCARSERVEILEHLWKLAKIDGKHHRYAEHTIRKVSELLYLSHSDFITAKLKI